MHRRFIKTHTPLDGVPRRDEVTYIAVIRHPLDVALSNADHFENEHAERAIELRTRAAGQRMGPGGLTRRESLTVSSPWRRGLSPRPRG
jgi:hypothetical protein